MKFTRQQELAVKERKKDILVSAGAGAGKTRVLVSRIADLITDPKTPVSADEILVMTFTNAAAQEMKERITKELSERLYNNPGDRYLRRQIRLIRQADISTVHSFCSRLLRNHFQEAGLDPSFRIGEEGEMILLRHQAMEELLEESYQSKNTDFLMLVEAFAPGKDDWILEDMIERLYHFSRGFPDAEGWFRSQIEKVGKISDPDYFEQSGPVRQLLEKAQQTIADLRIDLENARALCEGAGQMPAPERYKMLIQEDEDALSGFFGISAYQDYYKYFRGFFLSDLPRGIKKEEKEWEYLDEIKEIHKKVRETMYELRDTDFRYSGEELCKENAETLPFLLEFSRLALRYEALYMQMKKDQNVYDFDDLEHMTLKLLVREYDEKGNPVPSETAASLSRKYKEIFVDEYQDTSMVQETILKTLHPDEQNHFFAVGDVKQSIYRFRQARPDLFLDRQKAYDKSGQPDGANIELRDNFRSAPDVLNLCNQVFTSLMDVEFGGLDYDKRNALRAGSGGPMGDLEEKSEMLFLMEDEERGHLSWEYDSLYAETAMIAAKARKLINEGYRYSDMVILLRSGTDRAETMTEYLKQMKVPAECESHMGYFHTREVGVILNYLSVIDNVYQDIPMASALLSSIGGFREEEIALLKTQIEIAMRDKYSLYELMELYVDTGENDELRKRLDRFLRQLSVFRQQKKEMPLHQLLWKIYQETGFYYDVLLMSDGEKRRENLNMLLQKAEDYEKTVFKGLFYFIRYMDQLQSYEVELSKAGADREEKDQIRIMTIHKSKGLEFPVVFVSGLSKQFNFTDTNRPLLCHPEMGMGIEAVDLEKRIHHPSLMKKMLQDQIRKETLEEELRILYVAMTRAKRKLIMTGVVSDRMIKKHQKNPLNFFNKMKARSFMDWILPVSMKEEMSGYVRKIHLHELEAMIPPQTCKETEESLEEILKTIGLPEDTAPVEKAFSYEYPHLSSASWKRKYSVSELKKLSMAAPVEETNRDGPAYGKEDWGEDKKGEENLDIPVPDFLQEKKMIAPTTRGTIVHKIMELLPFGQISSNKSLYKALEDIQREYGQTGQISMEQVFLGAEAFLFSEEGDKIRQMDSEGRLYKEVPFTISIPASFVGSTYSEEENVIVQGIIDAYGEDEKGLWLIDYKTDHIVTGEEQILLDRYQKQMLYYKTALEMLIKKPVIRTYIYSFATRSFIQVPDLCPGISISKLL